MISEQVFDISDQLVSYCFDLFEKNSYKIIDKQQKLFVMHPKEFSYVRDYTPPEHEYIIDDRVDDFVQLAKNILKSNGFVIDESNDKYNVEMHIGNANEIPNESIFGVHRDDYGGIEFKVNTLIIYFNVNCEGGEIAFFDGEYQKPKQIIQIQNPTKSTCKVVMFEGNVWHNPLKYKFGERFLMSVQIPTIRN